jgi:peptide/nickel transport system substrate-binding protein
VRRSIERLIAVATPGPDYLPMRGAKECTPDHCDLSQAIGLNDAARTVTVRLEKRDPELLHKLANALIVPVASPLRQTDRPPPGTGPYRIKSWGARGGLLERNPHFRVVSSDRPAGYPNEISMREMPLKDQIAAVERGRADVAAVGFGLEPKVVGARTRLGVRMHFDGFPQTWFVFLNTQVPPFNDARARRALNYAVDRGRVAELLGSHETHKPTCQLLPPGFQGFTPSCRFTVGSSGAGVWTAPDLARARRLIAASGTRGMKVEFWASEPWAPLGGYFRGLLRRLGYRPRVRTVDDLGLILKKSTSSRPQAGIWGWIADSAGPMNFLTPLVSCAGPINLSHFCDKGIDAAIRDAAAAQPSDAVAKWRRVEDELASQSPTVPLVSQNAVSLTSERVGNYQFHTFFGPLLDQMWVK